MHWGCPGGWQIPGPQAVIKFQMPPPSGIRCAQMPGYCLGGWALLKLTSAL